MKKTNWKVCMFLCMSLLPWLGFSLELAKDGKTDYVIVCGNQGRHMEVRLVRESAADLAALLKQSTGADFKIIEPREAGNCKKRIFVGHSDAMLKLLKEAGKYKTPANEERVILTLGDDLFLYGGGFGDGFAVSHFLTEVLGFRFYHYWGDSRIPECKNLKTGDLNLVFRPSFEYRDLAQSGFNLRGCESAGAFFRRNALHNNSLIPFNMPGNMTHSYSCLIPPTKNYREAYQFLKDKEYFVTNPEFFPLSADGKREWKGRHRCFSNPGLRAEMNRNVEQLLITSRCKPTDNIVVNISHDDVDCKFCYCKDCVALEKQYGAPGGPLYDYLINSASPYFAEKYPNLIIRFLAYGRLSTEIPPRPEALKGGKLPANLMPYLAFLTADFNKPINAPSNKFIFDCFNAWGKISQRMSSYFYPATYGRPMISFPLFGNAGRVLYDVQFYGKNHVTQIFCDYPTLPRACNTAFSGLISYVVSRLYGDAGLDVNKEIDEYMAAIYGKAAPEMRKFYDELHRLAFADPAFVRWFPDPRCVGYLTPERLLAWQQAFDHMEKLVSGDARALLHIRCERLSLDAMTLLLYRDIRKAGLAGKISADTVYRRAVATADEIMKHSYNIDFKNHVSRADKEEYIKWDRDSLYNTLGLFYGLAKYQDKLPKEFGPIPEQDRFYAFFAANKMPPVEVKDAPFGYALPAPLPGNRVTGYDLVRGKEDGPNGRHLRVTTGTSKFKYHYLTRSKLGPDSVMGAPHLRGYVSRKFGSLSSFATGYLGYIFDPENPDQEYDIYVCLKFGKEQMYTSHLLLVKAVPGRKPFIRKKENIQETASISIVPTVQGDAFPAVEKMGRLGSFRNAATGEAEPDSTSSAYAAFGKDKLHLLYVEKNVTATDAKKDFYADTVEFFLPTGGKYPVTQIAVNPNGEVRCNEWTIPVTSNTEDTAVKRIMKSVRLPGKAESSLKNGEWTVRLTLDLAGLPAPGGKMVMNIFRTRNGKVPLAWSPIHTNGYLNGFPLFGVLCRDRLTFKGRNEVKATRFEGDVAVMDGNHGWAISADVPRGLDPDTFYYVTALLKTDSATEDGKHTTRMGTYDHNSKKVVGYRQIPVKELKNGFVPVRTSRKVRIVPGTLLYVGGFMPQKTFTGNMYLREFVIEKAE